MATEEDTKKFREVFETLKDYLFSPEVMRDDVREAKNEYKKAFEYTNTKVYPFYGQMVVSLYKVMNPNCSEKDLHEARVLGWCTEIYKNGGLMTDDLFDEQKVREGIPTWHTIEGVGDNVYLDSGFYFCSCYKIMKKYFGKKSYYVRLFDYFRDCIFWEFVAFRQDLKSDWKEFTTEKCEALTRVKSKVYMGLPLILAIILSGITDDKDYEIIEEICRVIGYWQQDQNDYMDFYGETFGTDIEQGRCTWLFGQALARCSEKQLEILKANYGRSDPACVENVRKLYNELKLKKAFAEHQKSRHNQIAKMIDDYNGPVPKVVLFKFLKDMDEFKYV